MEKSTLLKVALLTLIPSFAMAAPAAAAKAKTADTGANNAPAAATSSMPAKSATADLSKEQKVSYAIGASMADNLKQQDIPVDVDYFTQGFKDASGGKTAFTTAEMQQVLAAFQEEQQKKYEEKMKAASIKNTKAGKDFLDANKTKPGIVTTSSGLQYKINEPGAGDSPKKTDTVTVNYRGTLIDGTEFDSSAKHGQPATFPVNAVIPGWTEALQMMKPGAKWTLYIPANLAYGEAGAGRLIEPNSTLIFDVELLSVKPGDKDKK